MSRTIALTKPVSHARFWTFKLIFVPLLIFSLVGQCAAVWTQLSDIRDGYLDFVLYYSGAKIISDGKGARLYDLELQKDYQKGFGLAYKNRALPFNHPPYELLALVPLVRFPFPIAHILWATINALLLAMILLRLFPFVEAKHRPLSTLMLFACFPTLTALKMGQDSVITTYLLVETFVSLKRQRYGLAGCLLALGLYKPQFVLPLAGILFLHRRWRAIFGFVLTAAMLVAISFIMVGVDGMNGLLSLWLPMTQRGNVVWPELMMNLRGLVYMTLNLSGITAATNWVTGIVSLLVYFFTLRLWPRSAGEQNDLFDLRFSLAVAATVLVSFHLYSYDGTLLVISLILMLNHILKQPDAISMRHIVFLALLIALFVPLVPNVLLRVWMLAWWALPFPFFYGVIAMDIWRPLHRACVAGLD